MGKLGDDVSHLFIIGQIVFFGLLIAFVVFIAISDKRATKRLEREERRSEEGQESKEEVGDNAKE